MFQTLDITETARVLGHTDPVSTAAYIATSGEVK